MGTANVEIRLLNRMAAQITTHQWPQFQMAAGQCSRACCQRRLWHAWESIYLGVPLKTKTRRELVAALKPHYLQFLRPDNGDLPKGYTPPSRPAAHTPGRRPARQRLPNPAVNSSHSTHSAPTRSAAKHGGAATQSALQRVGLPCPKAPPGVPLQIVCLKTSIYGIAIQGD